VAKGYSQITGPDGICARFITTKRTVEAIQIAGETFVEHFLQENKTSLLLSQSDGKLKKAKRNLPGPSLIKHRVTSNLINGKFALLINYEYLVRQFLLKVLGM
jgi:hypothetical protein